MSAQPYDPATDHDPLFPMDSATAATNSIGEHSRKATPTVGSGPCPEAAPPAPRVGVVRQGEHVVWKLHYHPTHGGIPIMCRASGAAVCATGGDVMRGDKVVECRHAEGAGS